MNSKQAKKLKVGDKVYVVLEKLDRSAADALHRRALNYHNVIKKATIVEFLHTADPRVVIRSCGALFCRVQLDKAEQTVCIALVASDLTEARAILVKKNAQVINQLQRFIKREEVKLQRTRKSVTRFIQKMGRLARKY